MNEITLIAGEEEAGTRIDSFIASSLPDISRSYCKKLIKDGGILVNGKGIKPSYSIAENDEITVFIDEPAETEINAQDIPLDIIYEDEDIIVVNKKRGMVVHPSAGHEDGTLVNALLFHCDKMPVIGGQMRPGLVHRIDKDTTGLLVVAKKRHGPYKPFLSDKGKNSRKKI